jgi:diguanylate cyclase (GGDEF)-like protein
MLRSSISAETVNMQKAIHPAGGSIMGVMEQMWARMRGASPAARTSAQGNWKPERDPLTNAWSRNALDASLKTSWTHLVRRGRPLTLWMIQTDGIVYFGSPTARSEADRLLIEIARTLEQCAGPDDTVFRLSGASFAVLLPNRDAMGAAKFASEARAAVMGTCAALARNAPLKVRAGVASSSDVGDAAGLIELATARLAVAIPTAVTSVREALRRMS